MIIHITRDRYERIREQSWQLRIDQPTRVPHKSDKGVVEFHLLPTESAYCHYCGAPFDSVDANTPAQLEQVKEQIKLAVARAEGV